MIHSMTGYAAGSRELAGGALAVELRSVNHRYLDLQFRLPEELRGLEPALREMLQAVLVRGKVECRLSFVPRPGEAAVFTAVEPLIVRLAELEGQVRRHLPQAAPLSVGEVLRWPGVIEAQEISRDALREAALDLLREVLSELDATRAREGEKLASLVLARVADVRALAERVRPKIPAIVRALADKLAARLADAGVAPDEERLRQEIVLFAQRIDVDEELSRLSTHLTEVERVLAQGGAVGKRLDFLMQELNREANTLASKAADAEISQIAVEIKVLIEQMREQVQNIE